MLNPETFAAWENHWRRYLALQCIMISSFAGDGNNLQEMLWAITSFIKEKKNYANYLSSVLLIDL